MSIPSCLTPEIKMHTHRLGNRKGAVDCDSLGTKECTIQLEGRENMPSVRICTRAEERRVLLVCKLT
jgi:hypothetical protein